MPGRSGGGRPDVVVEPAVQRRCSAQEPRHPVLGLRRLQPWPHRPVLPADQALVAEQLDPGMILGIPARRALEGLAATDLESFSAAAPARPARRRWCRRRPPGGTAPAARRTSGSSRGQPAARPHRSARTRRDRGSRRSASCTATCPARTARPGRAGRSGPDRTPRSARQAVRPSARAPTSRRPPCARSSTPWCCQPEGR